MTPNRSQTRRSYTALTKLTLAALGLTTLAYASEFVLLGLDREDRRRRRLLSRRQRSSSHRLALDARVRCVAGRRHPNG